MAIARTGDGTAAYTVTMPRTHTHGVDTSASPPPAQQVAGIGRRGPWPLLPIGEAARRDPHIPDPLPNNRPLADQKDASPPVPRVGGLHAGGGSVYEGFAPALVYVKRLGTLITRSLGRELLMGVTDARWRVGGQGYPVESMMGAGSVMGEPGYHGDSTTVDPDNKFNPQVTMRNPGIRPIYGVPASYRYAPMGGTLLTGQYQGRIQGGRATNL